MLARLCLAISVLAGAGLLAVRLEAADAGLYGQAISPPAAMQPELKLAVADLQETLQQIAGKPFALVEQPEGPAVLLRRSDAADVPPAAVQRLPADNREACCLWPDGDRLWLISHSDTGLSHAVYLYLEQLGCRWYFPSAKWTIVPRRPSIRLEEPVALAPAFRSRVFAGTGGFGGKLPLDPERQIESRWNDWRRRNRFGGEFQVSGHTGEAFNLKYKEQLEAHPEWRAMRNGERQPWNLIGKFCAGNPEVVDLYVRDRVEAYRLARERDPESPRSWAVSVEPADGGGHCTAPESLALGSVSDRVFHVANQAARAVRKEFPDGRVSLFAYNEHAAPPTIPVEPNVYVQVIPYAFQRTGLSPEQLLDAWSKKVSRMGIYDYWSIPDWEHDLPTFDPLGFGPTRLRGWHRRGVDSFLCESTYSSGAMGVAWYVGGRLAWNPSADPEALFKEFTRDCFGPSAPAMQRLLRRWADGFQLTSHELALTYRDLQEAQAAAGDDAAVLARVADYARYAGYLERYFLYHQTRRGSPERQAAADVLIRYLWSIYDSSMVHAFRLSQLLARDERLAGNAELGDVFNWQDHAAPGWSQITPLSQASALALISAGVAAYSPQDFIPRRFTGTLTPATTSLTASLAVTQPPAVTTATTTTNTTAESGRTPVLWLTNAFEATVQAERPNQLFRLQIASQDAVRLLVNDSSGKVLLDQTIDTGEAWRTTWEEASIVLREPGLYSLRVVSQKKSFRITASADAMLTFEDWWNSQGLPTPRLYFYVPAGTQQLAMYANYIAAGPPRFFDPQGQEVQPTLVDQGHLLLLPIPAEQQGRIWSLDRAKCPMGAVRFLNAPQAFAFDASRLLVPQSALAKEPTDGAE
ncbi:DUF4838 domain-containing protein [Lignipirellula cremea]|uniref:DUF4838 domain-containing protein n=1 Tax=Lignipirellula cremea TaxID=2528010 RepID=A0A518E347_9BACT|nr:DUF4838 domain-containing protein [Lignipirellula cremea]QDU98516.1 hypothetical protein Pla8534_63850 [Lignipirellula cremea]